MVKSSATAKRETGFGVDGAPRLDLSRMAAGRMTHAVSEADLLTRCVERYADYCNAPTAY